jgi:hypothetical protein
MVSLRRSAAEDALVMDPAIPGFVRIREIAREHAAIRAIIARIEEELDRLLDHPAPPGAPWELPALARTLAEHLERHFQLEESGGLLGAASGYYPPAAQVEAGQLIAEHRLFECRLTRICDELASIRDPAVVVQTCFDGEIRRLVDDMVRHEAREERLLEEITASGRPSPD